MAKNVLTAERRLQLQEWIKKVKRSGFVNVGCIEDGCRIASTDLGFPISPAHIRKNAALLDIRLPRSHRSNRDDKIEKLDKKGQVRKSFMCPCGRRYSMGIYLNHKSKLIVEGGA